jgi:hypothetical protein
MLALGFCYFWAKPTCEASLKANKNINNTEKSKSLSAAVSRGKPKLGAKNKHIKVPACAGMTGFSR